MKPLGIVRKIDVLGRLVLPKEVRDMLDWDTGDSVELFATDQGIFLRKYNPEKAQEMPEDYIEGVEM